MHSRSEHRWLRRPVRLLGLPVLILLFGALSVACAPQGKSELAVGDAAPPFTLPTSTGATVGLDEYMGVKPVLLYFHMAVG